MAEHNEIGKLGENLAKTFLINLGFLVISKNFATKHGEIDLIVEKDKKLHFVEVKTIKVKSLESAHIAKIQPEDNLTFAKWKKLLLTIEEYRKARGVSHETRFQVDLACVYLDLEKREGRVRILPNVHKE